MEHIIQYKSLAVKIETFADCNLDDHFFDSLKKDYPGFEEWFKKKANEKVYTCKDKEGKYLGFLYLKLEDKAESYADIEPILKPKSRLKIGTFKVSSSGFRLGERFLQIIFDNALENDVEQIYCTLFEKREILPLYNLLLDWGFERHGIKKHKNGMEEETVVVKTLVYDENKDVKHNFPKVKYDSNKSFLVIKEKFHTRLIPDASLHIDDSLINESCRYAMEKVYITTATFKPIKKGDLAIVYCVGEKGFKKYSSCVTAVCVIKECKTIFKDKEEFFKECQDRSVFTQNELEALWNGKDKLGVVRFFVLKAFSERLNLDYLRSKNIAEKCSGVRPFDSIKDEDFDLLLKEAGIVFKKFI